jgi:hypothetical protein
MVDYVRAGYGTPTPLPAGSPAPPAPVSTTSARVWCGSGNFTDAAGEVWTSQTYVHNQVTASTNDVIKGAGMLGPVYQARLTPLMTRSTAQSDQLSVGWTGMCVSKACTPHAESTEATLDRS